MEHLPPPPAPPKKPPSRSNPRSPTDPVGSAAFEALKAWRRERSRADGVPAYIVFTNATLMELATHRPTTDTELLSIPGIGPTKLTTYGEDIKKILTQFH